MKKILSIVLCAAVASAFAEDEPAGNEAVLGIVGVSAITTPLSNVIVAVSYVDLAGGEGMVYSNLVKTTNLTAGDRLVEFRDNQYTGWVLEQSGEVKYWKEATGVFLDAFGNQFSLAGSPAGTVRGAVGTGIWLVRQNPTDKDGNAIPFYIYGKPVSDPQTTIEGAVEKVPTVNLVGNPKTFDVQLTKAMLNDNPTSGDRIEVPRGTGVLGRIGYTFDGTDWWTTGPDHKPTKGLPTIPANQGFWYVSTGTKRLTIAWPSAN